MIQTASVATNYDEEGRPSGGRCLRAAATGHRTELKRTIHSQTSKLKLRNIIFRDDENGTSSARGYSPGTGPDRSMGDITGWLKSPHLPLIALRWTGNGFGEANLPKAGTPHSRRARHLDCSEPSGLLPQWAPQRSFPAARQG